MTVLQYKEVACQENVNIHQFQLLSGQLCAVTFYQNNSPKVQVAVALRVKPPPHVPLPRALFCSFLMESSEKSKKIVSFTNQSDETSPSRTPVITSSPAGQQGGPCSSLIAGQSWLLHSPLSPLRPLEIAGPTLLLCSARWTPTGTL